MINDFMIILVVIVVMIRSLLLHIVQGNLQPPVVWTRDCLGLVGGFGGANEYMVCVMWSSLSVWADILNVGVYPRHVRVQVGV